MPIGIDPQIWNMKVAAGKAYGMLDRFEHSKVSVERTSVYGAALVMPQLARTASGSLSFTALAIRSYFLLFANLLLQGFLLYMIMKEERVLNRFQGKMRICDFGAHIDLACPGGPNCWGPGGTHLEPERLYSWMVWRTRSYVKQSLLNIFPEMTAEINEKIDPGEYGVESHNLRMLCCILFVTGLYADLVSSMELGLLLWQIPSHAEPWMSYEVPNHEEKSQKLPTWNELDYIKFQVAGMPFAWKVVNVIMVMVPKLWVWTITVNIGIVYLMETSQIEDMIINCATLAFILNIDEQIFANIMPGMARYIMTNINDYILEELEPETYWNKDAVAKHDEDKNWSILSADFIRRVFPARLLVICGMSGLFIVKYYHEGCRKTDDGSWVPHDVYIPKEDTLGLLAFLMSPVKGVHVEVDEEQPLWTYSPGHPEDIWLGGIKAQ